MGFIKKAIQARRARKEQKRADKKEKWKAKYAMRAERSKNRGALWSKVGESAGALAKGLIEQKLNEGKEIPMTDPRGHDLPEVNVTPQGDNSQPENKNKMMIIIAVIIGVFIIFRKKLFKK